jgi:hypothetical protein
MISCIWLYISHTNNKGREESVIYQSLLTNGIQSHMADYGMDIAYRITIVPNHVEPGEKGLK